MATLVLQAAGAAVGALFGPFGVIAGRAIGALAGYAIDQSLFGEKRTREGARLADLDVQASREGAAIPRIYGRVRLSGQVIWATRFEEEVSETREGGKGGGGGTTIRTYSYFANCAIGLCEGPVARIGRVWADGKPFDLSTVTHRFYRGDAAQGVDSLIEAKQGEAPAYRDTATIVFERFPLADFGNRLPQLSFEVIRPVAGVEKRCSRGDADPRIDRVRLRSAAGVEGERAGKPRAGEPSCRWRADGLGSVARRANGGVSAT